MVIFIRYYEVIKLTNNIFLSDVPAVAVVMFLVWIAVNLGIPKRFAPLLAWITGLIIAYFSNEYTQVMDVIYYGTFLAASAIGFHSGSKNTYQKFINPDEDNSISNNLFNKDKDNEKKQNKI